MMKVAETGYQRDRMRLSAMRLSMRGMVLGRGTQTKKHSTENVRQSFHLVNPPDFETIGAVKEKTQRHAPFPERQQLIPN